MKKLELVRKLQAFKGPIYVDICNFDDNYWIKAVKSDLIETICSKFSLSTDETGFTLDDDGYFSKDYEAQ